jgi:AmiR/NasT family two-component response regulator
MEPDRIAIVQNQGSPYRAMVEQSIRDLGIQASFGSFLQEFPEGLSLPPSLVLWDLHGFREAECREMARALSSQQCGVLLLSHEAGNGCREPVDIAGALGSVVAPRSSRELSLAIRVALATFKRMLNLRNGLTRADRDLRDRGDIEEAKRRIMRQEGCSEAQAMRRLQISSRNHNLKLAELARKIIQGNTLD